MAEKIKKILTNWRVLLLIIVILLSIWSIQPKFKTDGVLIDGVVKNSSAQINGVGGGETIYYINNEKISTISDYNNIINDFSEGDIIKISTNKADYSVIVEEEGFVGISVKEVPTSNLRKGLDLVGGARVIMEPEGKVTDQEMGDIVEIISKRLNVYGISDVVITPSEDLEGNQYVIIEIAGATQDEVERLVAQQGKFEAKIGEEVVFVGGKDIKSVCRSTECAGIDLRTCGQTTDGVWSCRFSFRVDVSPESAKKHQEITNGLDVIYDEGNAYLSEKLDLYLDDELFDSLYISEDLKGIEATSFVIQGPGAGPTKEAAINSAFDNMKRFQTLLITGSLPIKLNIAKIDIVSPALGETFFLSALMALGVAILAVGTTIFIRYRKLVITIPILITGISEVIIILGFAALIRWNLDLAAIAGILAAIGTGVDHQIVITDEVLKGETGTSSNMKERIGRAMFVIMAAYFTTVVAMAPLLLMGASLLKGFAITTIAGLTFGVFITRPAFAEMIKILLKEDE